MRSTARPGDPPGSTKLLTGRSLDPPGGEPAPDQAEGLDQTSFDRGPQGLGGCDRGDQTCAGTDADGDCEADSNGDATTDHRKGPRRRGDALTAAIFAATLAELAEVGYAELSMERVASRARASKGSLYRRWSNRAELVVDAMHHARPRHVAAPDTGSVREDLLGYLRSMAELLNGADGEAARGLMVEAVRDPELMAVVRTRFTEPSIERVLDVLRRGAVRGEVRPTALTHRIAGVGPGLLRQQFMIYDAPIPDDVVVELVDDVLMPLISLERTERG